MGKDICSRIKAILAERGIRLMDFYRDSGITSAAFSLWNTGKTAPSRKSLERICEYLGCKVSDLTDDEYYGILVLRGESKVALPEAVLTKTPAPEDRDGLVDALYQLRDEERALLAVTRDMTPEQVAAATEFIKTMKGKNADS